MTAVMTEVNIIPSRRAHSKQQQQQIFHQANLLEIVLYEKKVFQKRILSMSMTLSIFPFILTWTISLK